MEYPPILIFVSYSNSEELPRAYVVKAPGKDVSEDEIIKFMKSKVAPHKRLAGGVKFVDAITKNPVSFSIVRHAC